MLKMEIEMRGIKFYSAGEISVQRNPDGSVTEYAPQTRYAKRASTKLNRHGEGVFCRLSVSGLPISGGIYLVISDGEVRYVGKAANLHNRWAAGQYGTIQPKNCYVGGQSTNCHINKRVLEDTRLSRKLELLYVVEDLPSERALVENHLFDEFKPVWNLMRPTAS